MSAIHSETIEPVLAHCLGAWFNDLQKSGKTLADYSQFWYRVNAAGDFASACNATHATIAMQNHVVAVARYIEVETGINPLDGNDPLFQLR